MLSSPFLKLLHHRLNLRYVPFSERGSPLMVFARNQGLTITLGERWLKRQAELADRARPSPIPLLRLTDSAGQLLPFDLTTYPHRLDCAARAGDDLSEPDHPPTGEDAPLVAAHFGWSSALFTDLAIQAARDRAPA